MKRYLCRAAGCRELLDAPGYCPRHIPPKREDRPAFVNATRPNAHLYNSVAWRQLKRRKLAETPGCSRCGVSRRDGVRLEVHHIRPPRGDETLFFDPDNLTVVCPACHKVITAQEIARRKRRNR
ncbi:MAG: HNH endonuclease [Treponema sp.]|jgi:5-methylcytosine-specific restriction endonuclease McrA|nr:HNH endonuclease [Treponema sp.]